MIRGVLASFCELGKMVRPGGIEPPTFALEGHCSIQLSYGRAASPFYGKACEIQFIAIFQ